MRRIVDFIIGIAEFLQVLLFFYAFTACFYWLFQIFNIQGIDILDPYFNHAKKIINNFYQYKPTISATNDEMNYDLTLILVGVLSFILAIIIDRIRDYLDSFLSILNRVKENSVKKTTEKVNREIKKNLEKNYEEYTDFLYAVSFIIQNSVNNNVVDLYNKNAIDKIKEDLTQEFLLELDKYNKKNIQVDGDFYLFIMKDFHNIDNFLKNISINVNNMLKKYSKQYIIIKIVHFIEPLSPENRVNIEKAKKILNLKISNKFIVTQPFINAYSLFLNPLFDYSSIGLYQFSFNKKSQYDELFILDLKR